MNVQSIRVLIAACAVAVAVAMAGCGGSSSSSRPPIPVVSTAPGAGATPPASLAALTPGPGVATVPPANAPTMAPVLNPSPVAGSPTPSASPLPAPTGADLSALLAGRPPSAAYFAAISANATSAYILPPAAPKAVIGIIQSFVSDGFVLSVLPLETAAGASAHGAPYFATTDAIAAATVTAHASNATMDLIPGGFGRLRSGNAVIIMGSGDPSAFTMTAVTVMSGLNAAPQAIARQPQVVAARPIAARSQSARRPRDTGNANDTAFTIGGTFAANAVTYPTTPTLIAAATAGCISIYTAPQASVGFGHQANYPMVLHDASDGTYLESQNVPLPVRLINGGPAVNPTYQLAFGIGFSVGFNVVQKGCDPDFPDAVRTFPLSIMTIGQVESAQTVNPLPAVGSNDQINHLSCPFVPLTFGSQGTVMALLVNQGWTPSINFCDDFVLVGGKTQALATITHATLTSASNQIADDSWGWDSTTDGGDPNVMLIPNAAADGSVQTNTIQLESVRYKGTLDDFPSVNFSLVVSIPIYKQEVSVPIDSVFSKADGSALNMMLDTPDPFSIAITPHESNINVIGK